MKLNDALTLKEETVKKCLAYFTKIYGSPTDVRQAQNRRAVAEHEQGVQDGDAYYENSNKKAFFNDLGSAINQIKRPEIRNKFIEYFKAYIKQAPDDNYKCDVNGVSKIQKKVAEQNYYAQNTKQVFNTRTGDYTPKDQTMIQ